MYSTERTGPCAIEGVQHNLMLAAGKSTWLREMVKALEEHQEASRFEFFHSFTLRQSHLCPINQKQSLIDCSQDYLTNPTRLTL